MPKPYYLDKAGRRLPDDAPAEAAIALDVSEFSSLVLGCVPFERLYMYGLADITSEVHVGTVDLLFRADQRLVCLTAF